MTVGYKLTVQEGYWLLDDLKLIGLDGKKVEELLLKAGAKSLGMYRSVASWLSMRMYVAFC